MHTISVYNETIAKEVNKTLTPMKAIRAKCLDCCCGSSKEVELCPALNCSLYPYRFGKNPNIKLSEEQKAKRAAHFKNKPRQQGAQSAEVTNDGSYTPDNSNATESLLDA